MKRLSCFLAIVGLVLSTAIASAQQPNYRTSYPPRTTTTQPRTTTTQPRTAFQPRTPQPRPTASNIAVIDLPRIFKVHAKLANFRKTQEGAVQKLQSEFDDVRKNIQRMDQEMRDLKAGSARYMQLESQITNSKASFQAHAALERKQWKMREAKMLHDIREQIGKIVEGIAVSRGIVLVVQTSSVKSDPSNPDTVELNLAKQVFWSNPSIDITDEVLRELQRIGQVVVDEGTIKR